MEVDSSLAGVEQSLRQISRFVEAHEKALVHALEYVLRAMCNYVKQNGPWTDRTSNLRNSISININEMELVKVGQKPKAEAVLTDPVIQVEGDEFMGVLSAGMEYAIWVELEEGYWVLTGAIDRFEPIIEQILGEHLRVERLDLEEIAEVHYARYHER